MKKSVILTMSVLALLLISFQNASAGKTSTKYPVVLAHGMGASAEILGIVDYWGRIDNSLIANGAQVYKTSVNGMDGTVAKAEDFTDQVYDILAATGADKVNIIGHSHGTIYTRYAISNLGLAPYVASYTSISGPHKGSSIADLIVNGVPGWFHDEVGDSLDFIYTWIMGDDDPDSLQNALDITTDYMINVFNPNTPNADGVYYQSYTSKAKWSCPNIVLQATWLIMLTQEGANDGLVSVDSAKWGNFRGVEKGAWYSPGVDHLNIVDQAFGITPGFNAPGFYVGLVEDLKNSGF
ncbi:MAG: esterase/lipase family protein [Thermodesulfobacteriota bacterium]